MDFFYIYFKTLESDVLYGWIWSQTKDKLNFLVLELLLVLSRSQILTSKVENVCPFVYSSPKILLTAIKFSLCFSGNISSGPVLVLSNFFSGGCVTRRLKLKKSPTLRLCTKPLIIYTNS